jgi:hypothetical protein
MVGGTAVKSFSRLRAVPSWMAGDRRRHGSPKASFKEARS